MGGYNPSGMEGGGSFKCISDEDARAVWEEAESLDSCFNASDFYHELWATEIIQKLYGGDYMDITRDSVMPECQNFWDIIMPIAREIWKQELQKEGENVK